MRRSVVLLILVFLLGTFVLIGRTIDKHPVGEMVLVKSGSFIMGDELGDLQDDSSPTHCVTLTYDFWIGKYQVTFDSFDMFCEHTGRDKPRDAGWGRGQRPAIYVSWWDAIAYCNWLSEIEGLPVAYRLRGEQDEGQMLDLNGNVTTDITRVIGYRLPTEAEWEFAARGGNNSRGYKYAGSNTAEDVAWFSDNSASRTHEVGMKLPNELGIHDMSGNIWEWCADVFGSYTSVDKTNPYNSTGGSYRVGRGGSWRSVESYVRVADRNFRFSHYSGNFFGFRIARTVP